MYARVPHILIHYVFASLRLHTHILMYTVCSYLRTAGSLHTVIWLDAAHVSVVYDNAHHRSIINLHTYSTKQYVTAGSLALMVNICT